MHYTELGSNSLERSLVVIIKLILWYNNELVIHTWPYKEGAEFKSSKHKKFTSKKKVFPVSGKV